MNCFKCRKGIEPGQRYRRVTKGPYHRNCEKPDEGRGDKMNYFDMSLEQLQKHKAQIESAIAAKVLGDPLKTISLPISEGPLVSKVPMRSLKEEEDRIMKEPKV